jgi:hypothetical protein
MSDFLSGLTLDQAVDMVCAAVRRAPALHLDEPITPFATPRQLMGGGPPSCWRTFARRRWFERLRARWPDARRGAMKRHSVRLTLRTETLRVLASADLRGVGGGMDPSDEAGACGYTRSWCESYVVCYTGAGGSCIQGGCN